MKQRAREPLIIALSVIVGLVLGYFVLPKAANNITSFGSSKRSKLAQKIDYVMGLVDDEYVDKVNMDSLSDKVISAFFAQLDPHSVYLTKEELQKEQEGLDGGFEGIGIQFRIIEDTIAVIQPVSGGPSIKAGVMAGDRIVTINGKNETGKSLNNEKVMHLLKGAKGTSVKLGIKREGSKGLLAFDIKRDVIPTYSVDYHGMISSGVGYIRLSQFSQTTADEVHSALKDLLNHGMKELVFDLRGNGGGYLDQAYKVADEFLTDGDLIVYTQGRKRKREDFIATNYGLFEKGKLVVLIDEFSASASEIFAGAMQDNDRAMIIGRRTFGKGLVQEQKVMPDGSAVRITVARYFTPSGRCIQRPYIMGDPDDYFAQFVQRYSTMAKGEKDTIIHNAKNRFKTKKGRVVYGGGGIEPDIELPYYNYKKSPYYTALLKRGLLYRFCFAYVDKHRASFAQYRTGEQYIKGFNVNNALYASMQAYAEQNGASKSMDKGGDKTDIQKLMKAYIAQSLYNDKYYYTLFMPLDEDVNNAIKYIKK